VRKLRKSLFISLTAFATLAATGYASDKGITGTDSAANLPNGSSLALGDLDCPMFCTSEELV